MSWIGAVVVALVLVMLLWQWRTLRSARGIEGEKAPVDGLLLQGRCIYYFHSPRCGPCRAMTPRIDALIAAGAAVHKVDVGERPEMAAEFKVRATPTTVLVRDGVIERVYLGGQSEQRLRDWLQA